MNRKGDFVMGKKRNIIVGQSGGPTAVINSSLAGVYKTAKERGFHKVYGMLHGIEGFLDEMYVDLSTQIHSDMDIELLKRTPSAFLGSCRFKLPEIHENPEIYEKIFSIMNKLEIEVFIYIGGNDSMDTIKKLSDYAIVKGHEQKFLGVPKTIDNDLALTDHTPGFGSAAKYIAASTKEVIRDAMGLSYKRKMITIMEIMGRNAGWLTGATALAKTEDCCGPDLIYLPEIPFDVDRFLKKCSDLLEKKPSIVIAVSEGIKVSDGRYVCQLAGGSDYVDAFGHRQLAGTAGYLASFLAAIFEFAVAANPVAVLVGVVVGFRRGRRGKRLAYDDLVAVRVDPVAIVEDGREGGRREYDDEDDGDDQAAGALPLGRAGRGLLPRGRRGGRRAGRRGGRHARGLVLIRNLVLVGIRRGRLGHLLRGGFGNRSQ